MSGELNLESLSPHPPSNQTYCVGAGLSKGHQPRPTCSPKSPPEARPSLAPLHLLLSPPVSLYHPNMPNFSVLKILFFPLTFPPWNMAVNPFVLSSLSLFDMDH